MSATTTTTQERHANNEAPGGMSIGGWICLGLCVLLGVWLVIGLIRAFTGGGGGYGGGGYGGGGGGGFGSSPARRPLRRDGRDVDLQQHVRRHGGMFGGVRRLRRRQPGWAADADTAGDGDFGGDWSVASTGGYDVAATPAAVVTGRWRRRLWRRWWRLRWRR